MIEQASRQWRDASLFYIFAAMTFPASQQKIVLDQTCIELFVPDEEAVKKAWQNGSIAFPYWSKVWPAALALSRFLLRHPHYLQNKNALEAGAGLGLPSLVAAHFCSQVLCTDINADAMALVQKSADKLKLSNFRTEVCHWKNLPADYKADVLLLSDVNYEQAAFEELFVIIDGFLQAKKTIILSTPQRLPAKTFISRLMQFCTCQENINIHSQNSETIATIMVLQQI